MSEIEKQWDRPEIYRLAVPLPENPLKALNCYVLHEEGEFLVIDTGFNRQECAAALEAGLSSFGLRPERTRLFITHFHGDHCGLAESFAARGIPIYMGGLDYDWLGRNIAGDNWQVWERRFRREGFPEAEMERQINGNQARIYAPRSLFPVNRLADGDSLCLGRWRFTCIHTPGHTPGHLCLYCAEQQLLFSGDHILFDITPNLTVWDGIPNSLANYLASLEKIKRLPVAQTFPGHRKRQGDPRERIESIMAHHRQRLAEVLEVTKQEPGLRAYDIAGRISWSAKGRPWAEFPPNQRWFAVGETLAHLDWLLAGGYLEAGAERRYAASGKALPI